jgi:hypothetical protein
MDTMLPARQLWADIEKFTGVRGVVVHMHWFRILICILNLQAVGWA